MKCPFRLTIMQRNMDNYSYNEAGQIGMLDCMFVETQEFRECYKEECAAWDKKKKMCRKVGVK